MTGEIGSAGLAGEEGTLITRTYHCGSCRLFVRSEDDEGGDIEDVRKIVSM